MWNLFEFSHLGVCWPSWIYRLMCFIKFWKFWAIIFSNLFSACFCFSSLSGAPIICICWWSYLAYLWGAIYLSSLFFTFCSSNWIISIDIASASVILSSTCSYLPFSIWQTLLQRLLHLGEIPKRGKKKKSSEMILLFHTSIQYIGIDQSKYTITILWE